MMIRNSQAHGNKSAIQNYQTQLILEKSSHLMIQVAQDRQLTTARRMAWINVEMDSGAAVVGPCDAFVISSGKTAVVGALGGLVTLELGIVLRALVHETRRPVVEKLRCFLRPSYGLGMGVI